MIWGHSVRDDAANLKKQRPVLFQLLPALKSLAQGPTISKVKGPWRRKIHVHSARRQEVKKISCKTAARKKMDRGKA